MSEYSFQIGDLVEVRSAAEILATLDEKGGLDSLPFMPEMAAYCGRRFTVDKYASKICIYLHSRKVPRAVLLGDLRCDGSGHDGCQEECRIFWKEAWLRRVDPTDPPSPPADDGEARQALLRLTARNATYTADDGTGKRYRCQYTETIRASQGLAVWDPRVYFREYSLGNVSFGRFLGISTRAAISESLHVMGLVTYKPSLRRAGPPPVAAPPLNLQKGDWVQVKSKEEIAATLNSENKNRGLWFDKEMIPYCGKTMKVRMRVKRLIEYGTGKMIELKSDCLKLEGAYCAGNHSLGRWLCPRQIYPYWRECWLKRVPAPVGENGGAGAVRPS